LIARLRRQGVADGEAHAIDKIIRASLTATQRQAGALIQLSFGGDGWPWTLQSVAIEPVHGATVMLDRAAVLPQATPVAPVAAVKPVSVPATKPTTLRGANLADPFGNGSSDMAVAPVSGSTDPEWPVQPPQQPSVKPANQTLTAVHGTVGANMAQSLQAAGVPARIASDVTQAVTVHAPLRNAPLAGSRFTIAYEPLPDASIGFIKAEFVINGSSERIWRYRPEGGVPGFYTDDGMRIGG